ncbi:MAG: hypothetical protein K2O96_04875 [Lachnospiraceae bacterium]|nr:hypothetical protein [Lachnospiraceae bacterium]
MATDLKRFTISITPKMEAELDSAKQKRYYRGTQNDMIRDLITRGLATLKAEEAAKGKRCERAS